MEEGKTQTNDNSQQNQNPTQSEKPEKQRRRTRNDNSDRNFTCGCGKSYLSYPALYTHLKQKHDGQTPQGNGPRTQMPQSITKTNRGRPKKDEVSLKDDENSVNTITFQIEDLQKFLEVFGKSFEQKEIGINSKANLKEALDKLPVQLKLSEESFLKDLENNEEDHKNGKILQKKSILESPKSPLKDENQENEETHEIKQTNINKTFQKFLIFLSQFIGSYAVTEFLVLILYYRKALNTYAYKLVKKEEENVNNEYCEQENAENAVLICNDFVLELFPKYFQELNATEESNLNFEIIGVTEEKIKLVIQMVQFFGSWMFTNKYTNKKLILRQDQSEQSL